MHDRSQTLLAVYKAAEIAGVERTGEVGPPTINRHCKRRIQSKFGVDEVVSGSQIGRKVVRDGDVPWPASQVVVTIHYGSRFGYLVGLLVGGQTGELGSRAEHSQPLFPGVPSPRYSTVVYGSAAYRSPVVLEVWVKQGLYE